MAHKRGKDYVRLQNGVRGSSPHNSASFACCPIEHDPALDGAKISASPKPFFLIEVWRKFTAKSTVANQPLMWHVLPDGIFG